MVTHQILYKQIANEHGLTSLVEKQAQERRRLVLEAEDDVRVPGRCWYVSPGGKPDNEGNHPSVPWDSLSTLAANREKIRAGDAVLLERGGVYRGFITAIGGVYYGAYGDGEKPCICGSKKNYADAAWREAGDGLWTLDESFPADVGNIIFNHGEFVGYKKLHRHELCENYDFWCDSQDGNRPYLILDRCPKDAFESIEIAFNLWLFRLENYSDVVVDNLAFRYCGGHGIRGSGCRNIIVRNCEFGFIGGSYLTGFKDGTTRYGNAVEFMSGCQDILVENCWAYQIYDSAYTHQGLGDYCARNITFRDSLLECCGMGSIEYWLGEGSLCQDITYTGNIMRFAGYGFGGLQRPDKHMTAHIQSNGNCCNESMNFRIENNVFELSSYDLVNIQSKKGTLPILHSNTYIQHKGKRLGSYGSFLSCTFNKDAEDLIKEKWGDKSALCMIL